MLRYTQYFLLLIVFTYSCSDASPSFELTSKNLKPGQVMPIEQVFNSFGCKGKNIAPHLSWKNAPAETKSFAVTVYDPDAPTGSGWWHWTVANIPAQVTSLEQGAPLPVGSVEGRTDFGTSGYGGACPPIGDKPHRYYFRVYALNVLKLDLTAEASGAMFGYFINQHTLAKAELMVTFSR